MTPKFSVGALVGTLMLVANFWSYPANALTFQFSFNNPSSNDPAQSLVQGIISGLQDNLANQAAASVQDTSNPAGFGVGEYVGSPLINIFDVNAGVIIGFNFVSLGALNSIPAVTCCSLGLGGLGLNFDAGLTNSAGINVQESAGLTFTLVPEVVPLPAALPLFASGAGVLGFIGWRRKKKAAALVA